MRATPRRTLQTSCLAAMGMALFLVLALFIVHMETKILTKSATSSPEVAHSLNHSLTHTYLLKLRIIATYVSVSLVLMMMQLCVPNAMI